MTSVSGLPRILQTVLEQLTANNNILGWNIFENKFETLCLNIRFDLGINDQYSNTEACSYRRVSPKQRQRNIVRLNKHNQISPQECPKTHLHNIQCTSHKDAYKKRKIDSLSPECMRADSNFYSPVTSIDTPISINCETILEHNDFSSPNMDITQQAIQSTEYNDETIVRFNEPLYEKFMAEEYEHVDVTISPMISQAEISTIEHVEYNIATSNEPIATSSADLFVQTVQYNLSTPAVDMPVKPEEYVSSSPTDPAADFLEYTMATSSSEQAVQPVEYTIAPSNDHINTQSADLFAQAAEHNIATSAGYMVIQPVEYSQIHASEITAHDIDNAILCPCCNDQMNVGHQCDDESNKLQPDISDSPAPEPPDLSVPDPSVPYPSVPDPSAPDPSVPDPSVPDPSVPDPLVPDPSLPDQSVPDPSVPKPPDSLVPEPPDPSVPVPRDLPLINMDIVNMDNMNIYLEIARVVARTVRDFRTEYPEN